MTSSVVMNPRSLPLATRSRTSSSWASLANAIWSSTFPSGSHDASVLRLCRGFPQDSPSGLEGDPLFEYVIVGIGLLHRVQSLQGRLENIDVAGQPQLLQPPEHTVSVPAVLFTRERLHRQRAQAPPVGLVPGRLQDVGERAAGPPGLGQRRERRPGAGRGEVVL